MAIARITLMTTLVVKVLGTISGGQAMDLLFNIVFIWVSGLIGLHSRRRRVECEDGRSQ
jgi:hypothetical protein